MKKQVTTEQLSRMIQKGFDGIDQRMAKKVEVDRQFKEIHERFDKAELYFYNA